MVNSYQGKKVAIVGYGVEGQSSYNYWLTQGATITVCDANKALSVPSGVTACLGDDYLKDLDDFDLIVRSPGVLPSAIKTSKPVTSNMNEFLATCQGLVIGVTGTKGKGTVSNIIYDILKTAGKQAYLGGNIGKPPLDFVSQTTQNSISVLEMSNLQLWDITKSPDVAVLLMLAPEHLDWHHGKLEEYLRTKANITAFQDPGDLLIYDPGNLYVASIAKRSRAQKLPYNSSEGVYINNGQIKIGETVVCATSDIPLLGKHNWGNVCAAIAATWDIIKHDVSSTREAIRNTKPLPHRLQFVAEKAGVKYYDDSIATTNESVIAAVNTFAEPKIIILGGVNKGVDPAPVVEGIKSARLRGVILIGEMAPQLKILLQHSGFPASKITDGAANLPEVVKSAANIARPGDVVLLSPGGASFDMFKNYSDRGDQFQAAVRALPS